MHICAWCDQKIGNRSGNLHGTPATAYDMCSECLVSRLAPICPTLEKSEMVRARRMQRCGQSLAHIGDILGVSQPILRVALADASLAASG